MYKYLFITYGEPGWRGVQMRALRIASYFKKEEVLFWNLYDSSLIKDWGFAVETKPSGLIHPSDINFPKGTAVIIFADIPTNEFFQYSVYQAALQKKIKIVICDQLYRKGQMKEGVFKMLAENCDLFLLNSLSFFKKEEISNMKILPPQIEYSFNKKDRDYICHKYEIPPNSTILFGAGYHEKILEKIKLFTQRLSVNYRSFYTIVSGPHSQQTITKKGHLITLPFTSGDEYFKLLYSADIVLVKFGFLQILESLALNKPTVVLGEAGKILQNKSTLDKSLRKSLRLDIKEDEEVIGYLRQLVEDRNFRNRVIDENEKLHDGELYGAKRAAEEIQKLTENKLFLRKKYIKKIAILINQEIFDRQQWIMKQENIYPLCILWSMPKDLEIIKRLPESLLKKSVKDFQLNHKGELLPHSFKNVFIFSHRKYDGFTNIPSWYSNWIKQIQSLMKDAKEIYISPQGKKIFENLIIKSNLQHKLKRFDEVL